MIINFIILIALMVSFLNITPISYWEWAMKGDSSSHQEIKLLAGTVYVAAVCYYGWVITRVEVFQAYRKLPHTLIKVVLGAIWAGAILLMFADVMPATFEAFYVLVVLSLAIAGAILCAMHAEARRGPNADKIAAKIASARPPSGTVR